MKQSLVRRKLDLVRKTKPEERISPAFSFPRSFGLDRVGISYARKKATRIFVMLQLQDDAGKLTTVPPRLVDLKALVVTHVPSVDPTASCG